MLAVSFHHDSAIHPEDDMSRGSATSELITKDMSVSMSVEHEIVDVKVFEQVYVDTDTSLCVVVIVIVCRVIDVDTSVRIGGNVEPWDVDIKRWEAYAE